MMQSHSSLMAYTRANHTVPKTRQVVMLYDGVIRFLQQARSAMETGDYAERYNKLARCGEILMGLQSCLDFDQGGDTARILFDFYSAQDARIMALHRTNDQAECDAILSDLKQMREVWDRIDRGESDHASAPASAPSPADTGVVFSV